MKNPTLETAAKIIGAGIKSFEGFPEEIKQSMIAVMEMIEPDTEEDCRILHDNIKQLWEQGTVYVDMKYISEETGADFNTLMSLDYQTQMDILFEYVIDINEGNKDAVRTVYKKINRALEVIDLPNVAELLNMELSKLEEYPRWVQEHLCSMYVMLYDEDDEESDNSELIEELKNILKMEDEENEND